jgi:hypothetical protein
MASFRSADVIRWLIEACPTSLLEKDEGGHAPLHVAVRLALVDVVTMPRCLSRALLCTKDSKGRFLLHVAVEGEESDHLPTTEDSDSDEGIVGFGRSQVPTAAAAADDDEQLSRLGAAVRSE